MEPNKNKIENTNRTLIHILFFSHASRQRAKTDEFLVLWIEQTELERPDACPKCDGFDRLKLRKFILALLQVVVRDARSHVVNVMQTDVSGEPLKNFR